ncbi:hypothetical protein HPP92_006965 [Vanilla planifolia]|uniref:Uncharacterized protein n=1 Tax=Vanilla planifolia TaxID=51239 RepID=A0A835V5F8_VANPL|nr:hypothetical protein HPP92_006965 [Vanilla planifolia]
MLLSSVIGVSLRRRFYVLLLTPPPRILIGEVKNLSSPSLSTATPRDEYFGAIHHISNIVRRDFYLERTLNRLRLPPPTNDLVLRVLRATATSHPLPALRFFSWARSRPSYSPSSAEFDSLLFP